MLPLLYKMVEAEKKLDENFVVDGKTYLVRCPKCGKENYAMAVSSGICCWCGYDANELSKNNEEHSKSTEQKTTSER